MFSREAFKDLDYVQTGNSCVLASYAAAAYPFTRKDIYDYFEDYCRHFKIAVSGSDAESKYCEHFHKEYTRREVSGYQIIKELHSSSKAASFIKARESFELEDFNNAAKRIDELNRILKREEDNLVNVFIGKSDHAAFEMHSITIGYDDDGFYFYDVNFGDVQNLIMPLEECGEIGSTFVFRKKN